MAEYEYKLVKYIQNYEVEDTINEYAENGWRCVSVVKDPEYDFMIIFER